jgi:hypothetical protein
MAVQAGLGRHEEDVDVRLHQLLKVRLRDNLSVLLCCQLNLIHKFYYAAQLTNIASQAFSKASISFLFGTFAAIRPFVMANRALLILTTIWSIASFFTIAFQCDTPNTWDLTARCIDLVGGLAQVRGSQRHG